MDHLVVRRWNPILISAQTMHFHLLSRTHEHVVSPGCRRRTQVPPSWASISLQPFWHVSSRTHQWVQLRLPIVTYNVQTLAEHCKDGLEDGEHWRAALLREQFGLHAIGLQETRAKTQLIQTANFLRIIGGNLQSNGHHGCELWLSTHTPIGWWKDDKPILFGSDTTTVLCAESRLLVVRAQPKELHLSSLYAICHMKEQMRTSKNTGGAFFMRWSADTQDLDFASWWVISMLDWTLWILLMWGDASTVKGPTMESAWVSCWRTDPCGYPARLMIGTLEKIGRGHMPEAPTLDLTMWCYNYEMMSKFKNSYVDYDIQIPILHRDHELVRLDVVCSVSRCKEQKRPRRTYDWEKMATPQGQETLRISLRDAPQVGWDTDVHQHWQCLEDFIHKQLQFHFPKPKCPRRHTIFSDHTWSALDRRKDFKNKLRMWDDFWEESLLRWAVCAWRIRSPLEECFCYVKFQLYSATLLQRYLLHGFREAAADLKKCVKQDKASFIDQVASQAQISKGLDIYQELKKLRIGSKFRKRGPTTLPGFGGAMDCEQSDQIWAEHCSRMEAAVNTSTSRLLQRCRQDGARRLWPSTAFWSFEFTFGLISEHIVATTTILWCFGRLPLFIIWVVIPGYPFFETLQSFIPGIGMGPILIYHLSEEYIPSQFFDAFQFWQCFSTIYQCFLQNVDVIFCHVRSPW